MSALRIDHVLLGTGFGGAERVACTLHRLGRAAGDHPRVRSPRADVMAAVAHELGGGADVMAAAPAGDAGADRPPHVIERAREPYPGSFGEAPRSDRPPDVIHLHLASPSFLGHGAALAGPRPVVATFHLLPKDRWPADRRYRVPSRWMLRALGRLRSRWSFVAVSQADRAPLARFVPPDRLHTVVNVPPLPPARDDAPPLEWPGPGPRLLSVGRLAAQKGLDRLVPALAAPEVQRRPWTWTIIGDGEERPALEALVAAHGLADRVRFTGAQPAHAAFREADLVLIPSRFEGMPLVLLEALEADTPVLAAPIPAHRERLIAEAPEMLLPPDDAAWPAFLSEALAEDRIRGLTARLPSDRVPARERFYAQYRALYRAVCGRSPTG